MEQVTDMAIAKSSIVGAFVAAVVWVAWAFFSETRHNHGFWVAFLLPLTPIIIPVLWFIFLSIKYSSLLAFIVFGRREAHEEFMRKLKVRTGIFIFF